ncbi:MAG: hypothetical protein CSA44_00005, partial [Gammaproteobacteria bacterium]
MIDEDTAANGINVLGNDSDPDGDPLTVTSATSPDGTVTINPDGTLNFTPTPDFNGDTTITYTISDGKGGTDTATVYITVNPVNDIPFADDDAVSGTRDPNTGALQPVTINVLDGDSDPDGTLDPTTVEIVGGTNGGKELVVAGEGTWMVNPTSGEITFTPLASFNSDPTPIKYTVKDNDSDSSNEATVSIDYPTPGNQPPVADNDAVNGTRDPNTGALQPVTINVLDGDSDPDGTLDSTTVEIVGGTNGGKELVVASEGKWTVDPTSGEITFTPEPGFDGDPTPIQYTVKDN